MGVAELESRAVISRVSQSEIGRRIDRSVIALRGEAGARQVVGGEMDSAVDAAGSGAGASLLIHWKGRC
jgi:hypothetical protein